MAKINFNDNNNKKPIAKFNSNKKSIVINREIFNKTLKLKLIFEIAIEIDFITFTK